MYGGAKSTQGKIWELVMYVCGFPTWNDALSFEWSWKRGKGFRGRLRRLLTILKMERPTSKSTPYSSWINNFRIYLSMKRYKDMEKIEDCISLWSRRCGLISDNLFQCTFLSFLFPFHLNMSSVTNITLAQFQELVSSMNELKNDVNTLLTRLSSMGVVKAEPVPVPAVGKKATNKPERKVREKKVCAPPAEGTLRFSQKTTGGEKTTIFSPLHKSPFAVDGITFPTLIHFLAYKKFESSDKEYADKVLSQKNAALVGGMMKSKEHTASEDFNLADTLSEGLESKFSDPALRATLLETGDAKLEFESTTDSILGIGADCAGENLLGKALMNLRDSLSEEVDV